MKGDAVPLPPDDPIESAAADWLARRDRGLSAGEQDRFLDWIAADPRHAATLQRLDRTWSALDTLSQWRPGNSLRPNPDLLAMARPRQTKLLPFALVAAAAGVAASLVLTVQRPLPPPEAPARNIVRVVPAPEMLTLEDGSIVSIDKNARIEPAFTRDERRVRLVNGEAHFSVAKNPHRPFVVEAGAVIVRAVGTAFNVRRAEDTVDVLVTHGSVELEPSSATLVAGPPPRATPLNVGELARVDPTAPGNPRVTAATTAEIEQLLAWRGVRLQFADAPLSEVVAAFNLRNGEQLVIGDAAVADLRVGGTFRADNVDAFVRLLEMSFGVRAERRGDTAIVLWLRK